MDDESAKKRDWAVSFLSRLCLIGWISVILYEAFDFLPPVRQLCLFFGPWACVIALVNSVVLLLIRRQGIFFVFALIAIPPSIHFGYVVRNIAVEKKWIVTDESINAAESESNETGTPSKSLRGTKVPKGGL